MIFMPKLFIRDIFLVPQVAFSPSLFGWMNYSPVPSSHRADLDSTHQIRLKFQKQQGAEKGIMAGLPHLPGVAISTPIYSVLGFKDTEALGALHLHNTLRQWEPWMLQKWGFHPSPSPQPAASPKTASHRDSTSVNGHSPS